MDRAKGERSNPLIIGKHRIGCRNREMADDPAVEAGLLLGVALQRRHRRKPLRGRPRQQPHLEVARRRHSADLAVENQ